MPQGASFWYWYWMTWGTFPPIFHHHPDSIPVWKEFFARIYLLLSKSSKTEILQILSRPFPTIYVLLAKKKWKNWIGNFWQNSFPPSTCSLQYCHQRSWYLGKQWNEGKKTFKGSYSYKTRWNPGRCLKSEASSIMAKTLTSKYITKEVQNLCSNCSWQTPG